MKAKKIVTSSMIICLFLTIFSVSVFAKDESTNKLQAMGFSDSEIAAMDNIKKNIFLELYEKYDGTARVLPNKEGQTLSGENDINVTMVGGNVASCQSGYKCKGLSIVGGVDKNSLEVNQISTLAAGAAWSDNWNYISYSAFVEYGDFLGNPVKSSMTLIDAAPKAGLSFKYSGIPGHVNDIYTTVDVSLRRASGDSGTTDAVGKIGYTSKNTNISASISATPAINFEPTTDVYQKATTSSFYY